jgi:hypothetical protein
MRQLILPLFKKTLLFLVILLFVSTCFAKEASIQDDNVKAKNKVDIINNLLPKSCIFLASFHQQKKTKELLFPLLSSGQLFFNCEKGLIWTNTKPFKEDTIYTSSGINFRLIPNEPIEQLEGPQHTYLASLLLGILSADLSAIESKFKVLIAPSDHTGNNTGIESSEIIKLTPKNKNIEKRLNSIYIKKHFINNKEAIIITVNTISHQTTKIFIDDIKELLRSESEPKNIDQQCLTYIKKTETYQNACAILKNPQQHISLKANN